MLRTYNVFNVAQIDGLPAAKEQDDLPEPVRERAEAFIKATNAEFRNGGDKACYVPSQDFIAIRYQGFFIMHEAFYAVALHELGHSTAQNNGSTATCPTNSAPKPMRLRNWSPR